MSVDQQSQKLELKQKQLIDTIESIDREIADNYQKCKNSKGATQQLYRNKCKALLQKKQQYEKQLTNYQNNQFMLEQLKFTQENIQNQIEMGQALKQAHKVQKEQFEKVNFDEMEDIQDEMFEMQFEANYMNELMNRNYQLDVDEVDLDEEMRQLDDDLFQDIINDKNQIKNPGQQNIQGQQQQQQQQQKIAPQYLQAMGSVFKQSQ